MKGIRSRWNLPRQEQRSRQAMFVLTETPALSCALPGTAWSRWRLARDYVRRPLPKRLHPATLRPTGGG